MFKLTIEEDLENDQPLSKTRFKTLDLTGQACGVAKWLRCSASNPVGSTRIGSNPIAGITNHRPAASSVVYPSDVGKLALKDSSEGTSRNAAGPHHLHSCQES